MTGTSNLDFSVKMLLTFQVAFYIFLEEKVSFVIDSVGESVIKSLSTPKAWRLSNCDSINSLSDLSDRIVNKKILNNFNLLNRYLGEESFLLSAWTILINQKWRFCNYKILKNSEKASNLVS